MNNSKKVKRQTLPLVLITLVTVVMVGLTLLAVFAKDIFSGRPVETRDSSPASISPTAAATTLAETTAAPTEVPTPTPIVFMLFCRLSTSSHKKPVNLPAHTNVIGAKRFSGEYRVCRD